MSKEILKKQYEIDRVFLEKPWNSLTYSEIQKLSKKKSKGYIYKEIKRLIENKLIKFNKIGKRTILYNLELNTALAQQYWGFLKEYTSWNTNRFNFKIIENIKNKMPTAFFTLIVTGSYAKATFTKNSDLDVVIISNIESKLIYSELKYETETTIPKVHLYVFTSKQFLEMLQDKKENYGKEISRNNLIFLGGAPYYSLLAEAISNGFKG
ncbi:MAG: nucleotidyltransferase domain-containing protein [Nanoarchaeota archaeon]|nr:nucleotidyltransferase domain-containing protein [Nanoarchaeota archaeon]